MCVCVYMNECHKCEGRSWKKGIGSLGAGVAGGFEPPDVSAGYPVL